MSGCDRGEHIKKLDEQIPILPSEIFVGRGLLTEVIFKRWFYL